jgi:hypothetical protein
MVPKAKALRGTGSAIPASAPLSATGFLNLAGKKWARSQLFEKVCLVLLLKDFVLSLKTGARALPSPRHPPIADHASRFASAASPDRVQRVFSPGTSNVM